MTSTPNPPNPTEAMIEAGAAACLKAPDNCTDHELFTAIYLEMQSASPTPRDTLEPGERDFLRAAFPDAYTALQLRAEQLAGLGAALKDTQQAEGRESA